MLRIAGKNRMPVELRPVLSANSVEVSSIPSVINDPFSGETARGGLYLAGRYGLGVIVSTANLLVMTRWIGPHAYGLFVTAIGMVAFLAAVARSGVDTYLVRREDPPDAAMYGTAAILIFVMSTAFAGIAAAGTPLLIRWYGNQEFAAPYLVLLLTVPITGLVGVPMAKLERALDFRRVAAIELAGQSIGLLAAALLASRHAGVWAPGHRPDRLASLHAGRSDGVRFDSG